jgi:hypothetical protein
MILEESDDPAFRSLDPNGPQGGDGGTALHRYEPNLRELAAENGLGWLAATIRNQDFGVG